MLICRIFIVPDGPSPRDKAAVEAKLNSLKFEFKEFSPSIVLNNNYVELYRVNADAISMFEDHLNRREEPYDLVIEEKCPPKEIAAARFVPLLIDGNHADEDGYGNPLNAYPKVKCSQCLFPDESILPKPFLISDKAVSRVQDAYFCANGIMVLSRKFHDAVVNRFGDAIITGDVQVVESAPKRLRGEYFLVRPVHALGAEIRSKELRACPTCSAPIEVRKIEIADRVANARIILKDFGNSETEIALCGNWYGGRTRKRPMAVTRDVFVSGAAFAFLEGLKIRGLIPPSNVVVTCCS
jgi:hypothetical protein